MFLGHYAVACTAEPAEPAISLGTLVLAAQWLDLVWPALLLLDIEHVRVVPGITAFTPLDFYDYPWSHSLLMALVWSALFAAVALGRRLKPRQAALLGFAVFSHWILDFVTHRPDLPLWPGESPRVGLGLWHSVPGTLAVEVTMFAVALAIYTRSTRAIDHTGSWSLWLLVATLAILYVGSIVGPPPMDTRTLAMASLALWLFVPWGYWIDRHRVARPTS
jgi:membrane-bound metal-dependent hydrolase YbcI (DUF457 family)